MSRRLAALLAAAALAGGLLGASPSSSAAGDPDRLDEAPSDATVEFGDGDRAVLTSVDGSDRRVLEPLPREDGTTPGLIVTSDGSTTTLGATDSDAAPVVVEGGTAVPFAEPSAADEELVELRFEAIDRYGRPGIAHVNVFDVETGAVSTFRRVPGPTDSCTSAASSCILVPQGTYSLLGLVITMPEDQPSDVKKLITENLSLVGDPEVEVTEDRTVTLDARLANPVEVRTPGAETTTNEGGVMELGYTRTAANGKPLRVYQRPSMPLDQTLYLQPTEQVRTGGLETLTRLRLEKPDLELDLPRSRDLRPEYYDRSWFSDIASQFPLYDGRDRLRVVDVGNASADNVAGRDLRGAIAVAERTDDLSVAEQSNNAAAHGADLVVLYNDGPGDTGDPNGPGAMLEVPTVHLPRADGLRLLGLRPHDRVTVRGVAVTPYVYDLVLKERGRIPEELTFTARRGKHGNLSEQLRSFHGQPDLPTTFSEAAYPWQPGDTMAISTLFPLPGGPQTRPEYRIADPDTRWRFAADIPEARYNSLFPREHVHRMLLTEPEIRAYAAGERSLHGVGVAPVTAAPNPAVPFERSGDLLRVYVAGWTDALGNFGTPYSDDSGMSTHLVITADGEVVAETTKRPTGVAQLPSGDSRVSIAFTADNPQSWAQLSTHTETVWTFDSTPVPPNETRRQPVILAEYDVDLDLRNRSRHRDFGVTFSHHDGSNAPIDVTVEASYDGGKTWRPAQVRGSRVTLPRGHGLVSLRVHATDDAGSELDQLITNAWYVR